VTLFIYYLYLCNIFSYNDYNYFLDVSYALQKTTDKEYKDALGAWLRQANKRIKNKVIPEENYILHV